MRIKKFYELKDVVPRNWFDDEEGEEEEELSEEELRDRYREDLKHWPTSDLYSMMSDIYWYVDDERFI